LGHTFAEVIRELCDVLFHAAYRFSVNVTKAPLW
jgi:hypothetical protein